jgi:imidazolonepropionase-like amidohydrolase
MRRTTRTLIHLALAVLPCAALPAAEPAGVKGQTIVIEAGGLLDCRDGRVGPAIGPARIVIEGRTIKESGASSAVGKPAGARVIDLSDYTVLPGLADTHTHILLQGDVTEKEYEDQILRESIPLRTIRATVAARVALANGFTTLRDLETEGAGYADVAVKQAIELGYIDGPRLVVSTRALGVTGSYPLLGFPPELALPTGVQIVDGPDDARQAVREQLKYGADWIKVYADRKYYIADDGALDSHPNFTQEEMNAIVDEAHRQRHKVAAHAMTRTGLKIALTAGVDSIEHGVGLDEASIRAMVQRGVYYAPTLMVTEYVSPGRAAAGNAIWKEIPRFHHESFRKALAAGVKIVFGTDVGGFPWTEKQAREFSLMVADGMPPEKAIAAATCTAAQMLDMTGRIGTAAPGAWADLIAVKGDPLKDVRTLEEVRFVMKEGRVIRGPE